MITICGKNDDEDTLTIAM